MTPYYDLVLAILPFEPQCYKHTNLPCTYVGHPLAEEDWSSTIAKDKVRTKFKLNHTDKLLGVFVGSRLLEANQLLPIFTETINRLVQTEPNITAIFPAISAELASTITKHKHLMHFKYQIIKIYQISEEERLKLLRCFDAALVKSGTSSLELVFAKVPMIVAYKISTISFWIVKYLFRITKNIKFVSLANILMKRQIITEYLQQDCNPSDLLSGLKKLFDKGLIAKQLKQYNLVLAKLKINHAPSANAAKAILNLIK